MTIGEVDRLSRAGVVLLFAARWFAVQDNDVRRLRRLVLPALTAEALGHRLVVCWANLGAVLTATELAADLAGGGPRHEGWFLFAGGNRLGHEPVWLTRPPAEIIAAARRLVSGVLDEPVGGPAIALPSAG